MAASDTITTTITTITVALKPFEAIALGFNHRNPSKVPTKKLLANAAKVRSEMPLTSASIAHKLDSALQASAPLLSGV